MTFAIRICFAQRIGFLFSVKFSDNLFSRHPSYLKCVPHKYLQTQFILPLKIPFYHYASLLCCKVQWILSLILSHSLPVLSCIRCPFLVFVVVVVYYYLFCHILIFPICLGQTQYFQEHQLLYIYLHCISLFCIYLDWISSTVLLTAQSLVRVFQLFHAWVISEFLQ